MKISQRDLFHATVNHNKERGILFYADFAGEADTKVRSLYKISPEKSIRETLGMFNPVMLYPHEIKPFDSSTCLKYYEGIDITYNSRFDSMGVLHIPGSCHHFTKIVSPLRNAECISDLESYDWNFLNSENIDCSEFINQTREAHSKSLPVTCWIGRFYEDIWQVRGYQETLIDMLTNQDMVDFLYEKFFERNLHVAINAAKAGVDYVMCGDDVASQNSLMFSKELWTRFQKENWAKIYTEIKKIKPDIKIWYHSDGDITEIVPDLIEIGVDILNPVQPECMNPFEIKKKFGRNLVIDGAIGTQSVFPFGSPADVEKAVLEAIELLDDSGGFILSPSHVIEPEVPMDNVCTFINTANHFNLER